MNFINKHIVRIRVGILLVRRRIRWLWPLPVLLLIAGHGLADEQEYYKRRQVARSPYLSRKTTPLFGLNLLFMPLLFGRKIVDEHYHVAPSSPHRYFPKAVLIPICGFKFRGGAEAIAIGKTVHSPNGWLQRRDVLTPDEFKPVNVWPIKTYWDDFGDDRLEYRFKPDGSAQMRNFYYGDEKDRGKWRDFGRVRIAHGMVTLSGVDLLGFYDEDKKVFYCGNPRNPFYTAAYATSCRDRQSHFSDQEIAAFFNARAGSTPLSRTHPESP